MVTTLERAASKPLVNKTVLRTFVRELGKLDTPRGKLQYRSSENGRNNHQRDWRFLIADGEKATKWLWTPQGILLDLIVDEWRQTRPSTKWAERYYYSPFYKVGRGQFIQLDGTDVLGSFASSLRAFTQGNSRNIPTGSDIAQFVTEHADVILDSGLTVKRATVRHGILG